MLDNMFLDENQSRSRNTVSILEEYRSFFRDNSATFLSYSDVLSRIICRLLQRFYNHI